MDTEAVRARYRPNRIATLFVGESPPASGKFFYYENTALARNVKAVVTAPSFAATIISLSGSRRTAGISMTLSWSR